MSAPRGLAPGQLAILAELRARNGGTTTPEAAPSVQQASAVENDLRLTYGRCYVSDKSLAARGVTIMGDYPYGTDNPLANRGDHQGETPVKCVMCSVVSGLIVIDVDSFVEFPPTAVCKVVGLHRTVERVTGKQHLYVDARSLGLRGLWIKGGKIPGADIKGAGRGGFVVAAGATRPDGTTYKIPHDSTLWVWSPELEAALVADGCEIVPIAELGRSQVSADADEILDEWGLDPADEEDYVWVSGGAWGSAGNTDSIAVAVCLRLLNYAEDHPESAGDVFMRLVAGYELHQDYAGRGESQMRRALATAAARYVPSGQYLADRDRESLLPWFTPEQLARIEERGPAPGAAAVPVVQAPGKQTFVQMQAQPHGQAEAPQEPGKRRKRTTAANTEIRPVEYLWEPYVPANMITVLGGMEGSGKTQIMVELVGRVTRGGRPVIILSPEDPRGQVTVPRLIAAGADLARCHFYDANPGEEDVTLRADLTGLGDFAEEIGAALIVFDPIVSVLDGTTDGDSYADVSRELGRLTTWADERKVTVLAVTHLRKASDGQALNKMMGSRAFTSKPRSVLITAEHPEDPGIRLLAHAKSNVGAEGPSLGYTIEPALVDPATRRLAGGPVPNLITTSALKWCGAYAMWSASALMAAAARPAGRPPKIVEAAQFVRGYLEERGGAVPVTEVRAAAAAEGYGTDMLRGAELKTLARVTHQQTSGTTPTIHYWSLVGDDGKWTVPTGAQVTSWLDQA